MTPASNEIIKAKAIHLYEDNYIDLNHLKSNMYFNDYAKGAV